MADDRKLDTHLRNGGESSTDPSEEGSRTIPEPDTNSRMLAPTVPCPESTVRRGTVTIKLKDSRRASGKSTKPRSTSTLRRSLRSKKLQSSFPHQTSTRPRSSNDKKVRPPVKEDVKAAGVEWAVEKILDAGIDSETLEHSYLVKWEGCGTEESTWEPKRELTGCRDAIRRFEDSKPAYS